MAMYFGMFQGFIAAGLTWTLMQPNKLFQDQVRACITNVP